MFYTDVGNKIKKLAQVLGWAGVVGGVLGCIIGWASGTFFGGLLFLIVGALSIVFTWPLYAFGQLVDDTETTKNCMAYFYQKASQPSVPNSASAQSTAGR